MFVFLWGHLVEPRISDNECNKNHENPRESEIHAKKHAGNTDTDTAWWLIYHIRQAVNTVSNDYSLNYKYICTL